MTRRPDSHADSNASPSRASRRQFLAISGATGVAATLPSLHAVAAGANLQLPAETATQKLHSTLSASQKSAICFDWDHQDPKRGLLRTHIANNWRITEPEVNSDYFSVEQQGLIREIFEGIVQPDWHARFDKQLEDDAGGWGHEQSIAIFGVPGTKQFEFVLTGRHMTMRCDGNSADHVAFGGPIFYGHDTGDFNEPADHKGNVFWHQAIAANSVFTMLDEEQQREAMVAKSPRESAVEFRGPQGSFPGLSIKELSADQKTQVRTVLSKLIEPYRDVDREEVLACLKAQGGLDACHLAFYRDNDIGKDKVWDNWRLEGPSFVWYFRGAPHVHVWVNVADSPDVKLNA